MTNKILVVEDNPKHLADAKTLLEERVERGVIDGVDYTSTLNQAMESLKTQNYKGVLSDVFFPKVERGAEEPNGIQIGEYALDNGLPFVLVTSTYHHGTKTQPICDWGRRRGIELIDRDPYGPHLSYQDGEATSKEWEGAYLALAYLIEGKNCGKITINSEGLDKGRNAFIMACNMDYYRRNTDLKAEIEKWVERDPIFKKAIENYCQGMF